VDTNNKEKVREVLSQLRDGDILVLAIHSNPSVLVIGGRKVVRDGKTKIEDWEAVQWGRFWQDFGIKKPPKLAAVIIGGCMSRYYKAGDKEYATPINELELDFIRKHLNAWALFVPRGSILAPVAINNTNFYLQSMLKGEKLSKIDTEGKWHLLTDPKLDRDKISLFELRVIGKQLFQESDIDYLVPRIPPTEVRGRGVSGPPTLESIQDRESELWGAWGVTAYSGSWDFGLEEYDEAYVESWIITFIRPERAKEVFEYIVRQRRTHFANKNSDRVKRIDKERKNHPDRKIYGKKGQIHEEPNRLTIFFPADDYDTGENDITLLYNKNTLIRVNSLYFHLTVEERVSKIVKDIETGAMLAVDSALERAEVQLKGE